MFSTRCLTLRHRPAHGVQLYAGAAKDVRNGESSDALPGRGIKRVALGNAQEL